VRSAGGGSGGGGGGAGSGGAGSSGAGSSGAGSSGAGSSGAGSGGAGGGAGGGGSGGGGWSDRRLKRRIVRLGKTPDGLPLYRFQYIWGGPDYVGVMAQDLLELRPDAVIHDESGYLQVDYERLGFAMVTFETYQRRERALAL